VQFVLHGVNVKTGKWERLCVYRADFTYEADGKLVVEDAKGFRTEMYKLKKKWVKAEYGIDIREV
jgi:hypothetical protein